AGAPDLRRRGGPDGAGGVGRRAGQVRRHGRHVAEPHLLRRRRQDLPGARQRMSSALLFWLLVEALGLLALPVAATWLGRLPGRGLVLARLLAALAAGLLVRRQRDGGALWQAIRSDGLALRLWLAGEALFTVCFFGWAVLRACAPDVWGTEKP